MMKVGTPRAAYEAMVVVVRTLRSAHRPQVR
jgi:hypothetical protein